jgi:hypothetical protein
MYTAFPDWLTIPSTHELAGARHWHLTFAWVFVAATTWCPLVTLLSPSPFIFGNASTPKRRRIDGVGPPIGLASSDLYSF